MPEPFTQSASYHDVTITVREPMGSDVFDAGSLLQALPKEGARAERRRNAFVDAVLLTTVISGLQFAWPDLDSTNEQIQQAYDCWRHLDKNLLIVWANLIFDASHAGADSDLLPKAAGE